MLCYRCGRIGHRETQCTEGMPSLTTVLPHEKETHTPTVSPTEPTHVSTPWKTVQTRCPQTRGRPTEITPRSKTNFTETYPLFQPCGQASSLHTQGQRTHLIETAKGLELNNAKQPPGFNCGEVASRGKKTQLLQPCEIEQQCMQVPGDASCSRLPFQLSDVAVNDMRTPCMASCNEDHLSPQAQTM